MRLRYKKSARNKKPLTQGVVPVRPVTQTTQDTSDISEDKAQPTKTTTHTETGSHQGNTNRSPWKSLYIYVCNSRFFRFFASRRLKLTLAGLLFVGLLSWGGWKAYDYLHHSPNFGLKHIEISPTFHVERETLLAMAELEYGRNMFAISPNHVRRRILAHPWIRSVNVTKQLPDTLRIEVTEHEAAAVVVFEEKSNCTPPSNCAQSTMAFYLVDAHGEIFKRATPTEMKQKVIISGIARDKIQKNPFSVQYILRRSLELIALWNENPTRPELGEIQVADDIFILVLRHIPCEIHLEPSDVQRRMEMLDALLPQLNPPLEKTRVIYLDDRTNPSRVVVIPEPSMDATPVPSPNFENKQPNLP